MNKQNILNFLAYNIIQLKKIILCILLELCCCCWRVPLGRPSPPQSLRQRGYVLGDELEGLFFNIRSPTSVSLRQMAAPSFVVLLDFDISLYWREFFSRHNTWSKLLATDHGTFGTTDFTITYTVCIWWVFGGICNWTRPSVPKSDTKTTRLPTAIWTLLHNANYFFQCDNKIYITFISIRLQYILTRRTNVTLQIISIVFHFSLTV